MTGEKGVEAVVSMPLSRQLLSSCNLECVRGAWKGGGMCIPGLHHELAVNALPVQLHTLAYHVLVPAAVPEVLAAQ